MRLCIPPLVFREIFTEALSLPNWSDNGLRRENEMKTGENFHENGENFHDVLTKACKKECDRSEVYCRNNVRGFLKAVGFGAAR